MDYICLFISYGAKFKKLTDAQFGQLMRAAVKYAETGERATLTNPTADAYLDVVVADIDEKAEAERNRTRKASLARWTSPSVTDNKSVTEKNTVTDNKSVTTHTIPNHTIPDHTIPNHTNVLSGDNTEKEKSKEKKSPPKAVFTPPSVEEVAAYCRQRKNNVDAELFVAYYAKQGWTLGNGRPMRDWKSAVITWEKRDKERATPSAAPPPKKNGFLAMLEKWDEEHGLDDFDERTMTT